MEATPLLSLGLVPISWIAIPARIFFGFTPESRQSKQPIDCR